MNVNSDEATVLSAMLHGASLSRQFRTKNIKFLDISLYNVQVSYLAKAKSMDVPGATLHMITLLVFMQGLWTGMHKMLTFRCKNDFSLAFSYKELLVSEFPVELLDTHLGYSGGIG